MHCHSPSRDELEKIIRAWQDLWRSRQAGEIFEEYSSGDVLQRSEMSCFVLLASLAISEESGMTNEIDAWKFRRISDVVTLDALVLERD